MFFTNLPSSGIHLRTRSVFSYCGVNHIQKLHFSGRLVAHLNGLYRLITDELFFLLTLTLFDLKSATKQKWRGGLSTIEACICISQ